VNLTENLTVFDGIEPTRNATGILTKCKAIVERRTFIAGYNDGFQAALGRFNLIIAILFASFLVYLFMTILLQHGKLPLKYSRLWNDHVEKAVFAFMLALITYMFVSIFIPPYVPG